LLKYGDNIRDFEYGKYSGEGKLKNRIIDYIKGFKE